MQMETETSEKIEGLFLFWLEQLPEEAQIATVDLGLYTECTRDTDNGPSSSTQASEATLRKHLRSRLPTLRVNNGSCDFQLHLFQ